MNPVDINIAVQVFKEPMPKVPDHYKDTLIQNHHLSPKKGWVLVSYYDEGDVVRWEPRPFSLFMLHAWDVVEAMRRKGFRYTLTDLSGSRRRKHVAVFQNKKFKFTASSSSASMAICCAAIEALGSYYG